MTGGLSPNARETLLEHVDKISGTVAKSVWSLAINSVLDGEQIKITGLKRRNLSGPVVEGKILEHLAEIPEHFLGTIDGSNVISQLAESIDLPLNAVRVSVDNLQKRGLLEKTIQGRKISGLHLLPIPT